MAFIYIKGTPGSGKTTIRKELVRLGYEAHDADDKDMGGPYNNATNERVTYPEGAPSPEWFAAHSYGLNRLLKFLRIPCLMTLHCKIQSGSKPNPIT